MNIELVEQPDGRANDVLAQVAIHRGPFVGQVDLRVAADQSFGLKPGEQLAGGCGDIAGSVEVVDKGLAVSARRA